MEEVEIQLIEDIGHYGTSLYSISSQIKGQNASKIRMPINSYGGEVLESIAIYNYLKSRDIPIEANIIGFALSAGTIVASAADKVIMAENGYYMIHNPHGGAYGEAKDLDQYSKLLTSMTGQLADILAKKSGKSIDEVKQLMQDETWMTAKEALENGFIDEIGPSSKVLNYASIDQKVYNKIPAPILNILNQKNSNKMTKEDFAEQKTGILNDVTSKLEDMKTSFSDTIANEIGKVDFSALIKNAVDASTVEIRAEIQAVKDSIPEIPEIPNIEDLKTEAAALNQKFNDLEVEVAKVLNLKPGENKGGQPGTPAETTFNSKVRTVTNKSKY